MEWEAVLLAAGGSARLGRPKQLLVCEDEPLVRRAARAARDAGADRVRVVVGAHGQRVRDTLADLDVSVVENIRWQEGMGTSIACGARACPPDTPILVLLADQPAVDAPLLARLVAAARAGAPTAACRYAGTTGVPALFTTPGDLDALRSMRGDQGAKRLLQHRHVELIATAAPAHDIDVEEDWTTWLAGPRTTAR